MKSCAKPKKIGLLRRELVIVAGCVQKYSNRFRFLRFAGGIQGLQCFENILKSSLGSNPRDLMGALASANIFEALLSRH